MKNAAILARKDLDSYFHSWIGVMIFSFFFLIIGVFFCLLVFSYSKISLDFARNAVEKVQGLGLTRFVFSSLFLNMSIVLIFLVPIMTMRAFAEERKMRTLELLYTYPFSDFEIVYGKYLAQSVIFLFMLLPTAAYLILIRWLGGDVDWGPILTAYLGFWLLGTAYLSLGLFISSLTENQVASAIVTFGLLVIFWMLDWVVTLTSGNFAAVFTALSPLSHYREFTLGIFDMSHFVFFFFFNLYFLFLTLRSIETRNWKG